MEILIIILLILFGIFGILGLFNPQANKDLDFYFFELSGMFPDKDRPFYSLKAYRIRGGLLLIFTIFIGVFYFSAMSSSKAAEREIQQQLNYIDNMFKYPYPVGSSENETADTAEDTADSIDTETNKADSFETDASIDEENAVSADQ